MIRPLRQRHRVMIFALGVLVPAAFATGIVIRRPVPAAASLPRAGAGATQQRNSPLWTRDDLWAKKPIRTRLLADQANGSRLAVELSSKAEIVQPDLLAYWLPGDQNVGDTLPEDAYLLGPFPKDSPMPLQLPAAALGQTGILILYSLADHEVVAVSKSFFAK